MINFKTIKWGLGLVATLSLGLTGCYMDGQRAQHEPYGHHGKANQTTAEAPKAEKANTKKAKASREPVQQQAPGPKRAAAPQIPVIQ